MGQILVRFKTAIVIASLLVGCTKSEQSDNGAYKASIEEWHAKRVENLKGPNGWLNLAGLYWLKEGMNTFGSASTNDIVFPEKIAGRVGYFMLKQGTVTLEVMDGATVLVAGKPVKSMVVFHPDSTSAAPPRMEVGSLLWFVIKRDNQYGIRLRDLEAESVQHFEGIERYPVDEKWKVTARFEKSVAGKTIDITNVLGQTTPNPSPGTLVFEIDGKECRLDAIDEGGPDLFVIFGDPTNEKETYPSGRYVYVNLPNEDGTTIIDFNKSYNPPCAFTPFATCPLPPRQNLLTVPITAGEKNYGHHTAS